MFFTASLSVSAHAQLAFVNPNLQRASSAVLEKARHTRSPTIFIFHSDEFWLNLHHFLYVLGRVENKERDISREAVSGAPADQERGLAKLNTNEQKVWREAVASYATGLSKKDVVFDAPLPALASALARAGESKTLSDSEIDPAVAAILQKAASIYRKVWWKQHHEANRNWQKSIQALVDRHGAAVLAFITKAYKLDWPAAGFPIHVAAYSNWAGAYSNQRQSAGSVEPGSGQSGCIWFGNDLS